MRVADYIFQTLADWGVKNVFFVSGGGAMFLDDALGKEKRIQYVCCMHEQGAAIAAESRRLPLRVLKYKNGLLQ